MPTEIKIDDRQIRQLFNGLDKNSKRVISRALNKTAQNARTQAFRETSKVSGAQQKFIRRSTRTRRAKPSDLTAEIIPSSRRLPVTAFSARQTRRGVTFRGKNGKRELIPSAFLRTTSGGFYAAFKRKSRADQATGRDAAGRQRKHRLPLRKLRAVSVAETMTTSPVIDKITETIGTRWPVNVQQAVDLELSRI